MSKKYSKAATCASSTVYSLTQQGDDGIEVEDDEVEVLQSTLQIEQPEGVPSLEEHGNRPSQQEPVGVL
jgi:hypothetical protein